MLVVVGDARIDGCVAALIGLRRTVVLSVAIVAVASLHPHPLHAQSHPYALAHIEPLARAFDAVLPVILAPAADAELPLARAVAAVTAFGTADCISLPVDEVYPFFVRGGQLTCGVADGDDVLTAAALALAAARLGEATRGVRMLLHLETTRHDLLSDLALAAHAVRRAVQVDELWPTASVASGPRSRKRVSIVSCQG